MVHLVCHLSGSLFSKFGKDRLKIEDARDTALTLMQSSGALQSTDTATHTPTCVRTHTRTASDCIVCPVRCTWIGQTMR